MVEKQLSKACWKLWVIITGGVFFVSALCAGIIGAIIKAVDPNEPFLPVIGIMVAALLIVTLLILPYLRAFWRRFKFTYDSEELRVYSGVWWQKEILIPLQRITNVNIMQGPLQRVYKLATLKIETAGQSGKTSPETQLWSQLDYEGLRDELLKLVVNARGMGTGDGTSGGEIPSKMAKTKEVPWAQMTDLLKKIEENTRSGDR
ncbi:PH domain-containing protein [bacterium]|nr:PH domain-containing protein [bacterium]